MSYSQSSNDLFALEIRIIVTAWEICASFPNFHSKLSSEIAFESEIFQKYFS